MVSFLDVHILSLIGKHTVKCSRFTAKSQQLDRVGPTCSLQNGHFGFKSKKRQVKTLNIDDVDAGPTSPAFQIQPSSSTAYWQPLNAAFEHSLFHINTMTESLSVGFT